MIRRPPRSTRTDTLFPYTTLFRSEVHNVIVCTLCSCYPRLLIGLPPDWYKSRAYRSRTVREPRKVLAEFGTVIADDVALRVHDSTADLRYMVQIGRASCRERVCQYV